jgi:RimJ/RimL family protein N-acetyltransferase
MIPVLATERLTLRAPGLRDFEATAAFLASERAAMIGGPLDRLGAWRALAGSLGHWELRGYGMWAVEETATGDFLGQVGMFNPEGWIAQEIGWWLAAPEHEGKGFACEAALAARRYAYHVAGWREAFSVIHPDNLRSIRLAERLGATLDREQAVPGSAIPGSAIRRVYRHPAPEACR